jgi:hypothetical protein
MDRLKDVQGARARNSQEAQAKVKEVQSLASRLAELTKLLGTLRQTQTLEAA